VSYFILLYIYLCHWELRVVIILLK
jgi:hypothetical protein